MTNFLANMLLGMPPSTDERDIALGQFMHQWANIEEKLLMLFYILIGTTSQIAEVIFLTGFQSMNLVELFIALGQLRLDKSEQPKLKSLCKRYREAASKRNKIVHGAWHQLSDKKNPPSSQWARIYTPINRTIANQIYHTKNQKIRSKYRFTIKELQKATNHIEILEKDLWEFIIPIANRLYPDELP